VPNAVTSRFVVCDIDRMGYCVVRHAPEEIERSKRLYGPVALTQTWMAGTTPRANPGHDVEIDRKQSD
jgi:hypothetical protein